MATVSGPTLERTTLAGKVSCFPAAGFRGLLTSRTTLSWSTARSTLDLKIRCANVDDSGREDFWRSDGTASSSQTVSRQRGKEREPQDPRRGNREQLSAASVLEGDREPCVSDRFEPNKAIETSNPGISPPQRQEMRRIVSAAVDSASLPGPSESTAMIGSRESINGKDALDGDGRVRMNVSREISPSAREPESVSPIQHGYTKSRSGKASVPTNAFLRGNQDSAAAEASTNPIEEWPLSGSLTERASDRLDSNLEGIQARRVRGSRNDRRSSRSGYVSSAAARGTGQPQQSQRASPSNAQAVQSQASMLLNPDCRTLQRQTSTRGLSAAKQDGEGTGEQRQTADAVTAVQNTLGTFVNQLVAGGSASARDASSQVEWDATGRNGPRGLTSGSRATAWSPFAGSSRSALAGVFLLGIGAGVCVDTVLNIEPANVASREVIDRQTPNPNICLANGMSAMVLDQRLFISFNP